MSYNDQRLLDWLDDLCVRFIVNLPHEELQSVERICFQIEEAQWFYEDFIRPLEPSLPAMNLRIFSQRMFQHCPLFAGFSEHLHAEAYQHFMAYKTRVPVRGAIMLNHEMTHAVLVKGWKKGAKWSFPRGKINKDEPDLDCAIREVYEETGYDLREAGLVGPESEMKSIPVDLREQNMLLYVFRGVPMDTYFEPRTRKEISKIDWYKLGDLPSQNRKNQVNQNNFYMVAPFIGKLKQWIKQQRRQDKLQIQSSSHLGPPVTTGVTDTEELEVDLGETTADEAPIPDSRDEDGNFAELVANLGRHRASDALPEVSAPPQPNHMVDPAAELKRLLSVGAASHSPVAPVEAPALAQNTQGHPLLAMLQSNNMPAPPPELGPRTPFEQLLPTPQQPHSPHGQHHPRPPHFTNVPPPPPFPFHDPQAMAFHGPQHSHISPQPPNGPPPIPRQFLPPIHQNMPVFPSHAPNIQEAFSQQPPRAYQRTGDPQFAQPPQFPGPHGPAIPKASKLPPPKLTAHALGLLNTFKLNEKPAISSPQTATRSIPSAQATPKTQQPPTLHPLFDSFTSPPAGLSANPYAPSPPPFQSPPPSGNFEPVQPKPRSAHQDSLLNLFRSPSTAAATPPPQKAPEQPVELSAFPSTPGYTTARFAHDAGIPMPDATTSAKPNLLDAINLQQNKAGSTTATIRGPVNAPDFDTMKRNAHHPMNGHSRGPSPAQSKVEQKMFVPQKILRRGEKLPTSKEPAAEEPASPKTDLSVTSPPTAFKPQILKRPQQPGGQTSNQKEHAQGLLGLFKSQAPQQPAPAPAAVPTVPAQQIPAPAAQTSFDRRDTLPTDQKNTLLSLFSKSSQPSGSPALVTKPQAGIPSLPLSSSPIPPAGAPQPPTPKHIMSGVISPVSPLPTNGSQSGSPANLASRSRISSIGDFVPPSVVIPSSAGPTSFPHTLMGTQKNGSSAAAEKGHVSSSSASLSELSIDKGKSKANTDGKSPVDKTFLLGFLNDFANKGR